MKPPDIPPNLGRRLKTAFRIAIAVAGLSVPGDAFAQYLPPHQPGTICYTQINMWCWMRYPGPLGAPCGCPYNGGFVPGVIT